MKTYLLLGILTGLTTVLIGVHGSWLWGGTALLILLWIYAIVMLIFKRPKPELPSFNFIPGDSDNLDKLYHRAMQYCNDIIDHYQNTRYTTRRYYILSQIFIATLSGLTPILVLIDRDDSLKAIMPESVKIGLTWAMLISPGVAAVLATTSTLFKFQEEWIQAKKTAESLEAMREEFLLGASSDYRITATEPEAKMLQRKQALENFILKVNELHLGQVDRWVSFQRTALEQESRPEAVHVESLSNTQTPPSFPTQSSIALPTNSPIVRRSDASGTMTVAHDSKDFGLSETPISEYSNDLLSIDTLPTRSDQELDLDPPQQSSKTPGDLPKDEFQSSGPYLI